MGDQNTAGTAPEQQQGKTFNQDEVNRIVSERLAKEKAKANSDAEFSKREQDLARRELRMTAKETLGERGLPAGLLDALSYDGEESMMKGIETIEAAFNDYKANIPKPTFRGFQPGASMDGAAAISAAAGDSSIRQAMGIS